MAAGNHITSEGLICNWGNSFYKLTPDKEIKWKITKNRKDKAFLYNDCQEFYSADVDEQFQKPLENIINKLRKVPKSSLMDNQTAIQLISYVADLDYRIDGYINTDYVVRQMNASDANAVQRYEAHRKCFIESYVNTDGSIACGIYIVKTEFSCFVLSDHPVYLDTEKFIMPIDPKTCLVGFSNKMRCKDSNLFYNKMMDNPMWLLRLTLLNSMKYCIAALDTPQEILNIIELCVRNGWRF